MNFRPTVFKVIFSVILLIAVDLILSNFVICSTPTGGSCPWVYTSLLNPTNLAISVISFVVIYVIWSLIEKK